MLTKVDKTVKGYIITFQKDTTFQMNTNYHKKPRNQEKGPSSPDFLIIS